MFFVKAKLNNSADVKIELNDENIFCCCPECGKEIQVDLSEVLKDDSDLMSTVVFCEKCSKRLKSNS